MSEIQVIPVESDPQFVERILTSALGSDNAPLAALAIRAANGVGAAPTREIGAMRTAGTIGGTGLTGLDLGWAAFIDDIEYVPELKWPSSVRVFEQMRTDSQLSGLFRAMTYPIRRYKFMIDPNGADERHVQAIADDLNLDIKGQDPKPRGRKKGKFSWDDFLYHALLALIYGHMPFEMTGDIVPAPGFDGGKRWALRKLSPRLPRTLSQINIAEDGGLISVKQNILSRTTGTNGPWGFGGPEIPVDQLVWFAWEKEGPNWVGRSIFRDCYRNWIVKDRLIRIDAINHEKAGGIHVAQAPQGASPADIDRLNKMAQAAIVTEGGGGAIPYGAKYDIIRAGGGTDVIKSIQYHDEAMARLFLHMFLQLGQTDTGSRALGQAFVEYAFIAQRAVASWFCDVVEQHVIEDWMDYNVGPDAQAPLMTWIEEESREHLATSDLVALIESGAVVADDELEAELREIHHLPPKDDATARPLHITPSSATASQVARARVAAQEAYEAEVRKQLAEAA